MKSLMYAACVLAVLSFPLRAAAQAPMHADSPKARITLSNAIQVGPTLLKEGEYKFQCRYFDGKPFLVVTQADSGKEVARVPCEPVSLDARTVNSELRAIVGPDGKRKVQSVRIKGETVEHRVID